MRLPKPRAPWENYPPTEDDKKRIKRYEDAGKILKGDHAGVFGFVDDVDQGMYRVMNFCSLLSRVCADLLFGEDIKLTSPSGNKEVDTALQEIAERSGLQKLLWKSAFAGSGRGDSCIKVNLVKGRGAVIKSVPAKYFFPHFADDDVTEMTAATIAFLTEDNEGHKTLHREIHEFGKITYDTCNWDTAERHFIVDTSRSRETGFDGLLVFHVPNYCTDDEFFGISDFDTIIPVQHALNNAVTRLETVLDKYSDPLLAVPKGAMRKLEEAISSGDVKEMVMAVKLQMDFMYNKRRSQVFEGTPETLNGLPRYVEWNADLTSRLEQIRLLMDMLMTLSETSPALFGIDRGGYPDSGKAMRFRFFRTLAMVNRKAQFWDGAIRGALRAALTLEHVHMGGVAPELPALTWGDGLPEDEQEKISNAASKKAAGMASLARVVGEANSIEGEELDNELLEIKKEEAEHAESVGVGVIE